MKLQSFYLPITIFICVCITFVSVIDAYIVTVRRNLIEGTNCRLWVTDQNDNTIAGDGDGSYHNCNSDTDKVIDFPNTNNYWIHAKVQGSCRKTKNRGPFNGDVCFHLHGDVGTWWFDQGCGGVQYIESK